MQLRLSNSFIIFIFILIYIALPAQNIEQLKQMSISELMQVRITTASKIEELVEDAPGIVSVMTYDEIVRFGGTTLRDILERIPGLISMSSDYSSRSVISIRGDQIKQHSSHVLFLINGRPIREIQEGGLSGEIMETFPIHIIQKIEVVKGPGSVLYGSDAFSGVINLITEKPDDNKISVKGSQEINGGYLASGKMTYKNGDFSAIAAGRFMKKTEWDVHYKTSIHSINYNIFKDTTYSVSIPDKGPGMYLDVRYKGLRMMSSYNDWTTRYFTAGFTGLIETEKFFTNVGYSLTMNNLWSMDFNTTYTRSKLNGSNMSRRSSYNLISEWTNHYKLNPRSNIIFGALINRIDGEETQTFISPYYIISKGNINNYSCYAQINYCIGKRLNWIGGFQGNKVEKRDLHFVPRIGLIWNPIPKWSAKALYSEAYRAPSINELYMNFPHGSQGNRNLDPETIATTDLGLTYFGEKIQGGLSYFRSRQTNIIYVRPPIWQYQNLGKVTFHGVEIEGKYYLNHQIYLMTSMLYQHSENNETENLSPVPDFGAKAGFSYAADRGILLSMFYIYQGDPAEKYITPLSPHQGAYHLLHAFAGIQLSRWLKINGSPQIILNCQMDNILNKPHFGFPLVPYTAQAIPQIPGRRIYFSLSAEF